jgi:hypothetical protein
LLRVALPVAVQSRILILFRIVEAINEEFHEGGEVRNFVGLRSQASNLTSGWSRAASLIGSSGGRLDEKRSGREKEGLMRFPEGLPFPQGMLAPKLETQGFILLLYLFNLVVDRSRII